MSRRGRGRFPCARERESFGRGEFGQDLAQDSQGRIVAAGYTANGSNTEFALMRTFP
jgi:hypothetical protein